MSFSNKAVKIRNNLKKYKKESIILSEIKRLAKPVEEGYQEAQKMPWLSFLLIEWLFQVEESPSAVDATEKDVYNILNSMYGLQDSASNFTKGVNLDLALRRMLLSQLACQKSTLYHQFTLIRLYSLMIVKGKTPYFENKFKTATGVSLKDFFQISLWLILASLLQKGIIRYDQVLKELYPQYSIETISLTLRLLAGGMSELGIVMSEKYTDNYISHERYFAAPQLLKVPFFKFKDSIGSLHQFISTKGVAEYVLELFKANDHENFRLHFTRHFEEYVGIVIDESQIPYITEVDIKATYKKNKVIGKVIDFLLTEEDTSIFIDAKGIEPPEKILMTDEPEIIRQRLKKSFSKGVEQSFECADILIKLSNITLAERQNRFVLIVTHKEFYISNGTYLKHQITDDFFDNLIEKYGDHILIENVHFCCIEDFEGISYMCKEYGFKLSDFLRFCSVEDLEARTKKFDIRQHMQSFLKENKISKTSPIGSDYLLGRKSELFEPLIKSIKDNNNYWRVNGTLAIPEFIACHKELIRRVHL